jgi:membrane fusion protein (multidrug efflux system)
MAWLSLRATAVRWLLLALAPLSALGVGGYLYLTEGRWLVTENAYVKARLLLVATEVDGRIVEVMVSDDQRVEAGEPLFRLDSRPFQHALAHAEAKLLAAEAEVKALQARHAQILESLRLAETEAAFRAHEHQRQLILAGRAVVPEATLESFAQEWLRAEGEMAVIARELEALEAALLGDPGIDPLRHPLYLAAAATRDAAALDLERTLIVAPFGGRVIEVPDPGQHLETGEAALALVAEDGLWVEANFRETDLTNLRPGLPARLEVDSYPGLSVAGCLESISPASTSELSVLPPQNSSGNWVKVVQRVPVRITLPAGVPVTLRAGMSVRVEIDSGSYRNMPALLAFLFERQNPVGDGSPVDPACPAAEPPSGAPAT